MKICAICGFKTLKNSVKITALLAGFSLFSLHAAEKPLFPPKLQTQFEALSEKSQQGIRQFKQNAQPNEGFTFHFYIRKGDHILQSALGFTANGLVIKMEEFPMEWNTLDALEELIIPECVSAVYTPENGYELTLPIGSAKQRNDCSEYGTRCPHFHVSYGKITTENVDQLLITIAQSQQALSQIKDNTPDPRFIHGDIQHEDFYWLKSMTCSTKHVIPRTWSIDLPEVRMWKHEKSKYIQGFIRKLINLLPPEMKDRRGEIEVKAFDTSFVKGLLSMAGPVINSYEAYDESYLLSPEKSEEAKVAKQAPSDYKYAKEAAKIHTENPEILIYDFYEKTRRFLLRNLFVVSNQGVYIHLQEMPSQSNLVNNLFPSIGREAVDFPWPYKSYGSDPAATYLPIATNDSELQNQGAQCFYINRGFVPTQHFNDLILLNVEFSAKAEKLRQTDYQKVAIPPGSLMEKYDAFYAYYMKRNAKGELEADYTLTAPKIPFSERKANYFMSSLRRRLNWLSFRHYGGQQHVTVETDDPRKFLEDFVTTLN